jgi:hypothetical protein
MMLNELLVAVVSPVLVACSVYVPAFVIAQPVNEASPDESFSDRLDGLVHVIDPGPEAIDSLTGVLESDVSVLPN